MARVSRRNRLQYADRHTLPIGEIDMVESEMLSVRVKRDQRALQQGVSTQRYSFQTPPGRRWNGLHGFRRRAYHATADTAGRLAP